MTKIIEAPDWFNANNYDEAINFTYKDWFNQLYARFILLELLKQNTDTDNEWLIKLFNSFKQEIFPAMPEMPLIFAHIQEVPINTELVKNKKFIQKNLWSTTTSEVALNFAKLSLNKEALSTVHPLNSFHEPFLSEGVPKPLINKGKVRLIDELEPKENRGRKTLTVDLNAKETDIREDFEAWLKEAKKGYETNNQIQHISDDKKEKWATSRIIAYFDLKIWTLIDNQKFTNETLMDWIDEYGDYFHTTKSETYRRKLYSKLERELMNFTFFIRLFRTAYGENRSDSFVSLLRDCIKKHSIQKSNLTTVFNPMAEALNNWKPNNS